MTRVVALFVAIIVAAAAPARAQSWEMSVLAGYVPAVDLERQASEVDNVAVGGGFTWSFQAARFFTPHWGAEIVWSEQASSYDIEVDGTTADLFSFNLAQLHGNVVYQFGAGGSRVQPFAFGGLGATFFRATELPMETKFSIGVGGGVKIFPWSNVGFRGHLRYRPTFLDDEDAEDFCDPFGFCQSSLRQFEFAGGVTFRF
jgi:opacity protein-like surface antigen